MSKASTLISNLAAVKRLQLKRRTKWRGRIKLLDTINRQRVIHHLTPEQSKLATLYFKVMGRVDRDPKRPSVTTFSRYINMTPWTVSRELRVRAELLFCKTMAAGDHIRYHGGLYQLQRQEEKSI